AGGRPLRLTCATELEEVCRGLDADVSVADAPDTAEALSVVDAGDVGLDAWLVPDPWPAIVDETRQAANLPTLFPADLTPLARSPLVLLGDPDDLADCGWRCLGEQVAADLRLGWRSPLGSSVGLLTLGAAASGWFDGPDFASNDFGEDGFDAWLSGLVEGARPDRSPIGTSLVRPAEFPAAVSWEADAAALIDEAAPDRLGGRELLYPEPVATLDAVLASTAGETDLDVAEPIADALLELGWRPADGDDRDPSLPATDGLPAAGVLIALRNEVGQ
ncbi:MAG: hypothetical protein M3R01_03785, partial [Actinomycetota bacterium]|nr:hypothetical protein [Actinomycetota bacterium]